MDSKVKILIGIWVIGIVLIGSWWVRNSYYRCSVAYPQFCNRNCIVDDDCCPTCNYDCGCLRTGKKCLGDVKCEVASFSCRCVNNNCEIVKYKELKKEKQEQVIITTDKTAYEQGEMVKITVKNNLDKPIWYYEWSEFSCADSFFLEKKENEEYKYFSPPGVRKTPTKLVELKPNREKVYWLNLSKLKERCEGFSPEFLAGIYRLGFHYGFSIEERWSKKVYSNEFLVLPFYHSPSELSKETALAVANQFLQLECNTTFDEIETYRGRFIDFYIEHIFEGGGPRHIITPILERIYNQCPELEKCSNFWVAEKNISGENIIVVVGKNGEFICGFGAWGTNLKEICRKDRIIITTDKTEYEQGEIVKISVINRYSEEISLCNYPTLESPIFYVEKFENGTWISVCCVGSCRCHSPCMARIKRCWKIQPNQMLEFKWCQEKETCRNTQYISTQADSGKYRIKFNIGTSLKPIYSNEFTIK